MLNKKIIAATLSLALAISLTGCGGDSSSSAAPAPAPAPSGAQSSTPASSGATDNTVVTTSTDKVTIIWSHNASEQTAAHQSAVRFKELVEARSGGNITVELYANGDLGSVPENDQALREGTIQINSGTSGGLVDMSLSYFDAPNLATSTENAMEVFGRGTELRAETEKRYEAINMKVLSFVPTGFRVTSSNTPIRSYDDFKGLNIRTLENPVPIAYWKAWGANPTPIAFSELYIALQQGLVAAQENAYDTIVASKLYEQQKYVINTNHVVMWGGVFMNLDFFNKLPADYQKLVMDVWENELDQYTYDMCEKANDDAKQVLIDAGLEIIDLPEADLVKMRTEAKSAYDLIRQTAGDEIMNKIEAALK